MNAEMASRRSLSGQSTTGTVSNMKKCTSINHQGQWSSNPISTSSQAKANRLCPKLLFIAITLAITPLGSNSQAQVTNRVLSLGSTAYVRIPSAPKLQNPTEMTMEAWVYPTTCGMVLGKSDGQNIYSDRSYELSAGCIPYGVGVGFFLGANVWAGCVATNPWWVNGIWTHVAATFSSAEGKIRLYTNGILGAEATNDYDGRALLGKTIRQSSQPLVFGYDPPVGGPAPITLDDVRIWTVARTGTEIQQDMYRRLTGTEPKLAGYWNFDNGSATDSTTNGFNGTFYGGASTVADQVPTNPGIATAVEVFFNTGSPMTAYQVLYGLTVDSTNWVSLGTPVRGNGGIQSIFDSTRTTTNKFYRVLTY